MCVPSNVGYVLNLDGLGDLKEKDNGCTRYFVEGNGLLNYT